MAEGHQACLLYPATESRMERRMARQVVVGSSMAGARLDRVIEDMSTMYFRRRVYRRCPLLIAATNQSELSLIQGIVPKNDR